MADNINIQHNRIPQKEFPEQPEKKKQLAKTLLQRVSQLQSEQSLWLHQWQQCSQYFLPSAGNITSVDTPGDKRMLSVYDSTGIQCNEMFAASMTNTATPSNVQWVGLTSYEPELADDWENKQWFQDTSVTLQSLLGMSGFYTEEHKVNLQAGAFSTAALFNEWDQKNEKMCIQALHISEFLYTLDAYGKPQSVYRCIKMTAAQCMERFGEANVSKQIFDKYHTDPESKFDIIHAIYPNPQYKKGSIRPRFLTTWIEKGQQWVLHENQYRKMPVALWRISPQPGDKNGRGGPAMNALSDTIMLNKIAETDIRQRQLAGAPPIAMLHDGVARFQPGGIRPNEIIYVKNMDQMPRPILTATGSNVAVLQDTIQRLQESIRNAFLLDATLQGSTKYETAEAIVTRRQERAKLYGGLQSSKSEDYLTQVVLRALDIAEAEGLVRPRPSSIEGRDLRVTFESTFVRQQKLFQVGSINQYFQMLLPVQQALGDKRDLFANVDFDEVAALSADVLGVPVKVLKSPARVAEERRAESEARQQQMAIANAGEVSETIANLADAEQKTEGTSGLMSNVLRTG